MELDPAKWTPGGSEKTESHVVLGALTTEEVDLVYKPPLRQILPGCQYGVHDSSGYAGPCGKPAYARYTWPGKALTPDSLLVCEEHDEAVARAEEQFSQDVDEVQ